MIKFDRKVKLFDVDNDYKLLKFRTITEEHVIEVELPFYLKIDGIGSVTYLKMNKNHTYDSTFMSNCNEYRFNENTPLSQNSLSKEICNNSAVELISEDEYKQGCEECLNQHLKRVNKC